MWGNGDGWQTGAQSSKPALEKSLCAHMWGREGVVCLCCWEHACRPAACSLDPTIPRHPVQLDRFLKGSKAQPGHLKPSKPFLPGLDGQLGSGEAHGFRGQGQLGWVRGRGGASTISAPSPECDWREASGDKARNPAPTLGSATATWWPWGRSWAPLVVGLTPGTMGHLKRP